MRLYSVVIIVNQTQMTTASLICRDHNNAVKKQASTRHSSKCMVVSCFTCFTVTEYNSNLGSMGSISCSDVLEKNQLRKPYCRRTGARRSSLSPVSHDENVANKFGSSECLRNLASSMNDLREFKHRSVTRDVRLRLVTRAPGPDLLLD